MATTMQPEHADEVTQGRRLVRWAWVCVGLTPVGWVLAVVAEFAVGGGGDPGYAWYTQIPFVALWLTPGLVAFVLAFRARRADGGEGKVVLAVSAALLTFSVWAMVGGSVGLYAGIATAVACVVAILVAVYLWPGLNKRTSAA